MFIGHYKNVNSPSEFFSAQRSDLDFPTQVVYNNERYLIHRTIQIASKSQYKRIILDADSKGIIHDVEVD
jgi:hypothetical protein